MKTRNLLTLLALLLLSGQTIFSQIDTIPNGDGDLLWEVPLYDSAGGGRSVNDAVFHPINGNIIAAINWEIWEISPVDGHLIRKFEGIADTTIPYMGFFHVYVTTDGNTILTDWGGTSGLKIWDYTSGKIRKTSLFTVWGDPYPTGTRVICSNDSKKIIIYDYEAETVIKESSYYVDESGIPPQNRWRPYYLKLSKDGTLLAIVGLRGSFPSDDSKFSMEIWDGETLTHIKDFQNPDNPSWVIPPPQISPDNQWVLYGKWLYKISTGERVDIPGFTYYDGFAFSNDGKKLFISGVDIKNEQIINILNLENMKVIYQYKAAAGSPIRLDQDNELLMEGYDSTTFNNTLQFYSNNWTTVGIKDNSTNRQIIQKVQYEKGRLSITLNTQQPVNDITITDITGKMLYRDQQIQNPNGVVEIPLLLPIGTYFVTVEIGKSTYNQKFLVEE